MNSTQIVSILESRITSLEYKKEMLQDELAMAKTTVRQIKLNASILGVDQEIKHLRAKKEQYE